MDKKTKLTVLKQAKKEQESLTETRLQDKLLEKADKHVESFEYEKALEITEDLINNYETDAKILQAHSSVLLDLGRDEEAKLYLTQSIQLFPNEGYTKYMSLAQLSEGTASLELYIEGTKIIQLSISRTLPSSTEIESLKRDLSDAYCATAELYMSDLCDQENAEAECKRFLDLALESCEANPEVYRCYASFFIVTCDGEKAKEALKKNLSLWAPQYEIYKESGESAANNFTLPSISSRLNLAKNLIETEMYDESTQILEDILQEDDEEPEAWYLLGWASKLQGDDYHNNCRFYLKALLKLKSKCPISQEWKDHAKQMLDEIGYGSDVEDAESSEDEDNSDAWETDEDEEMA